MDVDATIKLGIETLLEVVENAKNIEICIVHENRIEMMDEDKLAEICAKIIKEKEEAEEAKKNKKKD